MKDGERMITVCAACKMATCWWGLFMCNEARNANVVDMPVSELIKLGREHPSFLTPESVEKYTGVSE
jgi:hypothetical protein